MNQSSWPGEWDAELWHRQLPQNGKWTWSQTRITDSENCTGDVFCKTAMTTETQKLFWVEGEWILGKRKQMPTTPDKQKESCSFPLRPASLAVAPTALFALLCLIHYVITNAQESPFACPCARCQCLFPISFERSLRLLCSGSGEEQWSATSWFSGKWLSLSLNTIRHCGEAAMGFKRLNWKARKGGGFRIMFLKKAWCYLSWNSMKMNWWSNNSQCAQLIDLCRGDIPKLFGSKPSFFCSFLINAGNDKWPCRQPTTMKIKSLSESLPSS